MSVIADSRRATSCKNASRSAGANGAAALKIWSSSASDRRSGDDMDGAPLRSGARRAIRLPSRVNLLGGLLGPFGDRRCEPLFFALALPLAAQSGRDIYRLTTVEGG